MNIDIQTDLIPEKQGPLLELLLLCLHQDRSQFPAGKLKNLSREEWQELADLAAEHRVVPMFYHRLSVNGLTEALPEGEEAIQFLRAYFRQVSKYNLRRFGEIKTLLNRSKQQDIPVILLKGIYLAYHVYENPGLREMNDVDILCRKKDLKKIYTILTEMGYRSVNPVQIEDIENVTEQHQHLAVMIKNEVAAFEIHWTITKPDLHFSINPEKLWQYTEKISFAGEEAFSLSAEDLLMHLCIHVSYQHKFSFGLRPFLDIAEVIHRKKSRINWTNFIKRTQDFGWGKGVYLSIHLARTFLGADVPDVVMNELEPTDDTDVVLNTAVTQIFTQKKDSGILTPAMVDFANESGLFGRIKIVYRQIFWPKNVMAKNYPVREGSLKMYFYYAVRFKDVCKRMAFNALKLVKGDTHLTEIASRKKDLENWLSD